MLQSVIFQQTGVFWVCLLISVVFACKVNHLGLSLNLGYIESLILFHCFLCDEIWLQGKKAVMKFRNSIGNSQRMNSYQFPNINSYMMPIPPPPPPNGKITRENRSETWRRRRFRPTTAPNDLEPLLTRVIMEHIFLLLIHHRLHCTIRFLGLQ